MSRILKKLQELNKVHGCGLKLDSEFFAIEDKLSSWRNYQYTTKFNILLFIISSTILYFNKSSYFSISLTMLLSTMAFSMFSTYNFLKYAKKLNTLLLQKPEIFHSLKEINSQFRNDYDNEEKYVDQLYLMVKQSSSKEYYKLGKSLYDWFSQLKYDIHCSLKNRNRAKEIREGEELIAKLSMNSEEDLNLNKENFYDGMFDKYKYMIDAQTFEKIPYSQHHETKKTQTQPTTSKYKFDPATQRYIDTETFFFVDDSMVKKENIEIQGNLMMEREELVEKVKNRI